MPDLHHGRSLDVECCVVESVFSPREIVAALMAGVEARKHNCNEIHAQLPSGLDWLYEMPVDRDDCNETPSVLQTIRLIPIRL